MGFCRAIAASASLRGSLVHQPEKLLFSTAIAQKKKVYPPEDTFQAKFNMSLYHRILQQSQLVLFCQYNNLKFPILNKIRFQAAHKGITCKFIVSRHFEQLIDQQENGCYSALRILTAGPVILFYGQQNGKGAVEPEAFQELIAQLNGNAKILFLGGWWEGRAYSHEAIAEVCGKLRSLANVRQMLVSGVLDARAREIVEVIERPMLELVHILQVMGAEGGKA